MTVTTKERILEAAKEIMLAKSYHAVGLNEILTAVKVPKGSFYHYFESKEKFGAELLQHYVREHSARLQKYLGGSELNPLERLLTFFEGALAHMLEGDCKQACLVAKLGSEVASFSEEMRAVLADGMREWRGIYEKVIAEGQAAGVIRQELKASEAAALIQDTWQGAMHRMQIERSIAPLRSAISLFRQQLTPA
jgi:TetR/AcrR family transcriptional repressor of nem operon